MRRRAVLVGVLLLVVAVALFVRFWVNLPPEGLERKGPGIVVFGLNLNDLVSLLGGIVGLVSGTLTLVTGRRKAKETRNA